MTNANGKGKANGSATWSKSAPPEDVSESVASVDRALAEDVVAAPTFVVDAEDGDDPEDDEFPEDYTKVSSARTIHAYYRERIEAVRAGLPMPQPGPAIAHRCPKPVKPKRAVLTRELIDAICDVMRGGGLARDAASHLGVRAKQMDRWLDLGRAGYSELHVELLTRTEQTRATWEVACLASLTAGRANWQSRAWLLQQAFPSRYAWARMRNEGEAPKPADDGAPRGLVVYMPKLDDE
jgi:hypothetical protein